jgi:hypothetical protein
MEYKRSVRETESCEEFGQQPEHNLSEGTVRDRSLGELGIDLARDIPLSYMQHFQE